MVVDFLLWAAWWARLNGEDTRRLHENGVRFWCL
jgi:hypothetical protein